MQSAANELEKCLQRPSTIADLTLALDNVAEKLTQLKRKVIALHCGTGVIHDGDDGGLIMIIWYSASLFQPSGTNFVTPSIC